MVPIILALTLLKSPATVAAARGKIFSDSAPLVALVDCNSFYVSCEQVFRQDFPGKPVIVLWNSDGCVVARSIEANKLGIAMGAPLETQAAG